MFDPYDREKFVDYDGYDFFEFEPEPESESVQIVAFIEDDDNEPF